MSWCPRTIAVFLLLFWGTVTVHCGLEVDGLIGKPHHATASSTGFDDSDIDADGCISIENGYFAADGDFLALAQPLFVLQFALPELEVEAPQPSLLPGVFHGLAPPELSPSWAFVRRASLPSRAPSSVS